MIGWWVAEQRPGDHQLVAGVPPCHPAQRSRAGLLAAARARQQHPGLPYGALPRESVRSQDQTAGGDVVSGDPHLSAAGQRASHRAELGAADVDQDRAGLGGGIELQHARWLEALLHPPPEPARHARADEQAERMVTLAGLGRGLNEAVERGPGVGGHGDAVAADLLPEGLGLEAGRGAGLTARGAPAWSTASPGWSVSRRAQASTIRGLRTRPRRCRPPRT